VLCLALRHAVATAFNGPDREARALEVCPAGNGLRRATRVMAGCLSTPAERACAQHRSATRAPRRFMGGPDLGHASHTAGMFSTNKEAARQQGGLFSMGGSSNGGKAIGTLWSKSMVHLRCCQGCFRRKGNIHIFSHLGGLFPIWPVFTGFLPQAPYGPPDAEFQLRERPPAGGCQTSSRIWRFGRQRARE
jgi:hypothetical protein